jgi:hypothetical protein
VLRVGSILAAPRQALHRQPVERSWTSSESSSREDPSDLCDYWHWLSYLCSDKPCVAIKRTDGSVTSRMGRVAEGLE